MKRIDNLDNPLSQGNYDNNCYCKHNNSTGQQSTSSVTFSYPDVCDCDKRCLKCGKLKVAPIWQPPIIWSGPIGHSHSHT